MHNNGEAWKLEFRATRQAHADALMAEATPEGLARPVVTMTKNAPGFVVTGNYDMLAALRDFLKDRNIETNLEQI